LILPCFCLQQYPLSICEGDCDTDAGTCSQDLWQINMRYLSHDILLLTLLLSTFLDGPDCIDEMVCFQRDEDEPVPGCEGVGDFSIDYCVGPNQTVDATASIQLALEGNSR